MCIKAVSWVLENCDLQGTTKLVLIALADNSDNNGDSFPGMTNIAKRASLKNKGSVIKHIKKLEEEGYLLVANNKGAYTACGNTNRYTIITSYNQDHVKVRIKDARFVPPKLANSPTAPIPNHTTETMSSVTRGGNSAQGVTDESPGGYPDSNPKGYPDSNPEPSLEPSVNQKNAPSAEIVPEPKRKQPRNHSFEAIAEKGFEITDIGKIPKSVAGRVGKSLKEAREIYDLNFGNAVIASSYHDEQLAKLIRAFYGEYTNIQNLHAVRDSIKFATDFTAYVQRNKTAIERMINPIPEPEPPPEPDISEAERQSNKALIMGELAKLKSVMTVVS